MSFQAVVNIKAKLNRNMNRHLQTEENRFLLKQHSGVEIIDEEGVLVLTGDLTEISIAREILLQWQTQEKHKVEENMITQTESTKSPKDFPSKTLDHLGSSQTQSKDPDAMPSGKTNNARQCPYFLVPNTMSAENISSEKKLYPELETKIEKEIKKERGAIPKLNNNVTPFTDANDYIGQMNFMEKQPNQEDLRHNATASRDVPQENLYPDLHNTDKKFKSDLPSPGKSDLMTTPEDSVMMITKKGVKVYVYQAEICRLSVQCIVNSSNSSMKHEHGLSYVIAKNAGQSVKDQCERFIKSYGILSENDVCVTTAGSMSHYQKILHVKAPRWTDKMKDEDFFNALSKAVEISLTKANSENMTSVALPAISSGMFQIIYAFVV